MDILRRLANKLRARGFEVQGPRRVPGTDEVIMYIISDAAGEDPTGGGIGALDASGLGRFSVLRQPYREDLAVALPDEPFYLAGGDPGALSAIEIGLMDVRSGEMLTYRCNVEDETTPRGIVQRLAEEVVEVGFTGRALERRGVGLWVSAEGGSGYRVAAVAAEYSMGRGLRTAHAGSPEIRRQPRQEGGKA